MPGKASSAAAAAPASTPALAFEALCCVRTSAPFEAGVGNKDPGARHLFREAGSRVRQMEIRALGPGDDAAVVAAQHLFDGPARAEATARFLEEPGSHLLVGYVDGEPAGFVSGVEVTHPDKGTEMFLFELAVGEAHRRRGHGRALIEALELLARERGCVGMFVFVDDDNEAGRAAYRSAGGRDASRPVMVEWAF